MLPPFYYKDVSDDGLYGAYSEIINRVASNRLRVYLYHFPQMSATPISLDLIERLIADFPETVVGLKDSSGVKQNMLDMIDRFPGFAVFPGADSLFAEILQAGGAGCITAVSNISAPLNQLIYSAWVERGESDPAANQLLVALKEIIASYSYFSGLKAILADHSGNDSWLNMRPPLCPLSTNDQRDLLAAVKDTGYEIPSF
jgi:4-hydroxy-tetrahydrodipicolinate synthase